MALPYDPNFTMAVEIGEFPGIENDHDHEHEESVSAAIVAVDLISSARLALELDSAYTDYSAQYLLDNAGSHGHKLTVKHCLEFALKKGIPKAEDWPQLGSVLKPPSSYKPALVSMKGKVIEPKDLPEACDLVMHQPVGTKLHVFSPHIDLQREGIYCGPSGEPSCYVGLRDGIIVAVEKIQGKSMAIVKLWYKKKFIFLKVALSRMFCYYVLGPDKRPEIKPTGLLVDFCVPRLSIN